MKNTDNIVNLVTGNINPEDKKKVLSEIHADTESRQVFIKVKAPGAVISSTKKQQDYETERSYLVLQEKIHKKTFPFHSTIGTFLKYAAILVILIGFSILFYLNKQTSSPEISEELKYTSVVADNRQISKIILPDSSIVWLNSGTTLSYPSNFSEQNREVSLNGQAFFQINHKENNPFLVQANGLIVKVLGTKFDVNAYPENNKIAVVLESGKVELTREGLESFNYTMQPGEKASFSIADNSLNISHVDTSIYSSWKDGKLIFRNEPIKNVVEKLKRWYNINIEVTDEEVYNSIFSGTIQNESYEEIFRYIEVVCDVNCKLIHNYEEKAKPAIIISKK